MKIKILQVFCIIITIFICIFGSTHTYNFIKIKTATVKIILKEDLTMEFLEQKKISDFIQYLDGKIIDDTIIDSTEIGKKDITFELYNKDNIKLKYSFQIEIKDKTEPTIWLGKKYSVPVNSEIDLTKKILCGDNYDPNPTCKIEGFYDLNTVGEYPLIFRATDNSGNEETQEFTLTVYEPQPKEEKEKTNTDFEEIKKMYKNEKTRIGIDISNYQGDIDFEKIKDSGVEFVIIRIGFGHKGKYTIDKRFIKNIEAANMAGIDTGIYFFSYDNSIEEAKKSAKWVLNQIKNYKVKLPIAFDWEDWGNYNDYHLSFFGLTSMAEEFMNEIKKNGYDSMLYSSKAYLENIWLNKDTKIWLAHYSNQTNYKGNYEFWQICDNGKVNGIDTDVDIDIQYIK